MRLLTWLTVIYLVVLVAALAVSLITIFIYLWRIGSALAAVQGELGRTQTNTTPLENHLETINGGLVAVRNGLKQVDENLFETNESLSGVAAHLGIGSVTQK